MGNVVPAGEGQAPARQAAIAAGVPVEVGAMTINKVCGSGLKAVMLAAAAIRAGDRDFYAAGGMESMNMAPFLLTKARFGYRLGNAELVDAVVHDGLWYPFEHQHMGLAAESLGLGMCYIGSIRNNTARVIELLELPRLVFPDVGMTIGWPAAQPTVRPRLPVSAVLHWEKYDPQPKDEEMLEYDRTMIDTGIYEGRQVPVPGKPEQMENYGWTEHSARRVAKAWRTELREVLEEQGFGLK